MSEKGIIMVDIDKIEIVEKIDRSNALDLINGFPEQCLKAKDIGLDVVIPGVFSKGCSNLVFAGLGGSAIGADLIRSYTAGEIRVPVFVNRNYILPHFISRRSLVIASSYSGNTEETLSAYKDAKSKNARIIAITSGGKLAKYARRDRVPLVTIPEGYPPRCALGFSFFPILILLGKMGFIGNKISDIGETIKVLEALRDERISQDIRTNRNLAKRLALKICGRYPVIYGGQDHMDSVAVRWRGQFAENSKTISSSHVFPEMNHNEIVGWENPKSLLKKFVCLMLRDTDDHPRNKVRMDITRDILKKKGFNIIEVESIGESLLARMFSLIYTGDFTSFYLAILNRVDPTPVDRIVYLKKKLAKAS